MNALDNVLSEVESRGIKLVPKGDKLDIVGPSNALTEELIQELKAHKAEILRVITNNPDLYGCTIKELKHLAEDDWDEIKYDVKKLQAFARLVATRKMRERGEVPPDYTGTTNCQHCGIVPIWGNAPKKVLACVWCFNRVSGKPIPAI